MNQLQTKAPANVERMPGLQDQVFQHPKLQEHQQINKFARVSDRYYQKIQTPDGNQFWKFRDKQELKQDGINLANVPTYHGFTVCHNFQHHEADINGWLNLSAPLKWQPTAGEFPTILRLFKHVFGEQKELGLDYIQLILHAPWQLLPILVLGSKEQSTGKSTFLNFIQALFGTNAVILNVSQYSQQFNAVYASKLIIGIDETVISEAFVKERLKQDSTAKTIQLRKMHSEHESIPFFGKFILATNKETDFTKLDDQDTRFWVRKLEKVKSFDPKFDQKAKLEIPYFLDFLARRHLSVPTPLSRQWFSREQLQTDALAAVLKESKSRCAKDILAFAEEKISETGQNLFVSAGELAEALKNRYTISEVVRALRLELKLEAPKQVRYTTFAGHEKNGRPYYLTSEL